MTARKMVVAVDFDGTLCEFDYPGFGAPNIALINQLLSRRDEIILILWTCRENKPLADAVAWSASKGLFFDYVNDNAQQSLDQCGVNSRKILADFYIDDKAIMPDGFGRILDVWV